MTRSLRSLLPAGLRLLLLWSLPASALAQDTGFREIFEAAATAHPRFAISAAYVTGDGAPVVLSAGPTESGGTVRVAADARWHVGSIGKTFTASLMMRLAERGAVDLDAPIGRYLPAYRDEMHADWRGVSLRQVLSHTAGLPANAPRRIMRETLGAAPDTGRREVLSTLWTAPTPGEIGAFAYSNIGYVLAGLVIEEMTGRSWEAAIIDEIAAPLGLGSLGFGAPREADAPRGHRGILGFKRPVAPDDIASDNPRWMGPAGTLHLSLADLARWGQVHLRACAGRAPDFLSAQSCRAMQVPVSSNYGMGWVIEKTGGAGRAIWHDGSNTMWYAVLYLVPERDIAVAVATNVFAPQRMDRLVRALSAATCG